MSCKKLNKIPTCKTTQTSSSSDDHHHNNPENIEYYHKNKNLIPTDIVLSSSNDNDEKSHYLYLPKSFMNDEKNVNNSNVKIDGYLGSINFINFSNKELIERGNYTIIICGGDSIHTNDNIYNGQNTQHNRDGRKEGKELIIDDNNKTLTGGKYLYVCQREVAHTTHSQNDIIASDDVTTCHIISLHSHSSNKSPLSSLAHVDKPLYESCIRKMIKAHKEYHTGTMIHIYVHILGGFNDTDGSSYEITQYILSLFTKIANEERNHIKMILKTCLVSSLNHKNDKDDDPIIGRGLAMNTKTGCVYLIKCIKSFNFIGPEIVLRSCRIYSHYKDRVSHDMLSIIHTYNQDNSDKSILYINPIRFKHDNYHDFLLAQEDDSILLNLCSTSPLYERRDFCSNLRETLCYIRDHDCYDIFGENCDCVLKFVRVWNEDTCCYVWI